MNERLAYFPDSHKENVADLKAEFERKPADHVVITGYRAITPLGDENQTFEKILKGESAITPLNTQNWRTNIGGVIEEIDLSRFYPREKDLRRTSRVAAMAELLAADAAAQAGIVDHDGNLVDGISRDRISSWIGSGIGPVQEIIEVNNTIQAGETRVIGSKNIDLLTGLRIFPQDVAARPAMRIGAQGWSGSTAEACATGASNFADAYRIIKDGYADIAITGGVEDALLPAYQDSTIGIFAQMRIVSGRNEEPDRASRPFDRDRDGFVLSSGGAVFVIESLESAERRDTKIYGEVLGAYKSIDGDKNNPTSLDPENVARTIYRALKDEKSKKLYMPDVIFAHATSTKEGDRLESKALELALRNYLPDIPVTAIKSALGHLLGGAGSVNIAMALKALETGVIPPIANLENVGEEFKNMQLVRKALKKNLNSILTVAYGFGGFNAAVNISRV